MGCGCIMDGNVVGCEGGRGVDIGELNLCDCWEVTLDDTGILLGWVVVVSDLDCSPAACTSIFFSERGGNIGLNCLDEGVFSLAEEVASLLLTTESFSTSLAFFSN